MGFKGITINTPPEQEAHIRAEDDAAIYGGIIGGDCVLDIGSKMSATVITNNKVRIQDGVVSVGGHMGRIIKGDYEEMTIENGISGKNRNDIICARLLRSGEVDTFKLVVVKGTPGTTAADPAPIRGNLYEGDAQRDYPLWRVKIEGLSIVKVEQLYELGTTTNDLRKQITELNSNFEDIGKSITTGKHGKEWTVSTAQYWDIGNTISVNNEYYQSSPGSSTVTIKKPGMYFVIVNCTVTASGDASVWGQLQKNGVDIGTHINHARSNYCSLSYSKCITCVAGDKIKATLSAVGTVKSTGDDTMQIIKIS